MRRLPEPAGMVGYCVLLGLAQYGLYSLNFKQFFQGDAIFWMQYRFHSLGDFLKALGTLDVGHWYRPLSNRTIPSLFYPFWELEPYGYHLVVFGSFFAVSCLVLLFLRYLTGRISIAFPAAFCFGIHTNNFYTTYDFAFAPELFYVFFYVSATWFFIEAERRGSWKLRMASVAAFVLSLMSKEAAVTLPAMLVLSYLAFIRGGRTGFLSALRAIRIHVAVWIAYLVYIVGYLRVGSGSYMLSVGGNVLRNLSTAFYYAFNLRRDGWMPARAVAVPLLIFLVSFAVLQLTLALCLLFREERKLVLYGMGWFVIGLAPMLMLTNDPGPYYLFLGMVGFSLVVGICFSTIRENLRRRSPWIANALSGMTLLLIWISCRSLIVADTAGDFALGYSSMWGANSMEDMLKARAQLPHGANIYILDESMPDLWRFQGLGSLFKLVYRDNSITTLYRSTGQGPDTGHGELIVMKVEGEHLVDVTAQFRQDPRKFLGAADESSYQYVERPGISLSVTPAEVTAGRDFYWMTVSGWGERDVVVQYTINDGPVGEGTFRLNSEGRVRFFVSALTAPGVYQFLRFRAPSASKVEWFRSEARLLVLPPASAPN
jgi:hypothetical protein